MVSERWKIHQSSILKDCSWRDIYITLASVCDHFYEVVRETDRQTFQAHHEAISGEYQLTISRMSSGGQLMPGFQTHVVHGGEGLLLPHPIIIEPTSPPISPHLPPPLPPIGHLSPPPSYEEATGGGGGACMLQAIVLQRHRS